jgi:hypothetical protein
MGTTRDTTLQAITVEYEVSEELDGTTPAPVVQIDQSAPNATPFDRDAQIYRPAPVERLGLIDPDLIIGGSIGPRCIPFVTLDTDELGGVDASLDVVGVRVGTESDVVFQRQIRNLDGVVGPVYIDEGFNVPQGSDMRLRGYTAPPGEPVRVRASILVPTSCLDVAAFKGEGEPGQPILTQTTDELPAVEVFSFPLPINTMATLDWTSDGAGFPNGFVPGDSVRVLSTGRRSFSRDAFGAVTELTSSAFTAIFGFAAVSGPTFNAGTERVEFIVGNGAAGQVIDWKTSFTLQRQSA